MASNWAGGCLRLNVADNDHSPLTLTSLSLHPPGSEVRIASSRPEWPVGEFASGRLRPTSERTRQLRRARGLGRNPRPAGVTDLAHPRAELSDEMCLVVAHCCAA